MRAMILSLILLMTSAAIANPPVDLNPITPYRQKATLVYLDMGEYVTRIVMVPILDDAHVLACFKLRKEREARCIYVNNENGDAEMLTIMLPDEDT